ncbi:translation initiation factor IF-2-like [Mustela erminea]|uniref:translation initiation factor IF-2-like n=1 Tax=Mustela erminea TaxID=36723 RepID=UPI0013867007|nr:translation initiation factor IF-2-like [Mustela erminea]
MPVVGARGSASEFSPAQPPLRSSVCPAAPGTPLPALPAALSRRAGARTRAPSFPAPAPTHGVGLPKSNAEAPPGKEVRLPLHPALLQSGFGRKWLEHPPRAFAVSLRFAEGKQLPPKSCHPLPSRKTRAGDQRKDVPRRTEGTRKGFSRRDSETEKLALKFDLVAFSIQTSEC